MNNLLEDIRFWFLTIVCIAIATLFVIGFISAPVMLVYWIMGG